MSGVQFEIRCGQDTVYHFFIYRPENEPSDGNKNQRVVFNGSGTLNPELFCKMLQSERGIETCDLQVEPVKENSFRAHRKNCDVCLKEKPCLKFRWSIHLDGYCLSAFHHTLKISSDYRSHVFNFLYGMLKNQAVKSSLTEIIMHQDQPKKHLLDYAGGRRLEFLLYQRMELEHAMAWLSTLGGAFSALGDHQTRCAIVAGHISVQQFRIAVNLGDELTKMRCILYYGYSLIQRGYLKQARKVIEHQYNLAKAMPYVDSRILSMCHGIWARLKYERKKKITQKIIAMKLLRAIRMRL